MGRIPVCCKGNSLSAKTTGILGSFPAHYNSSFGSIKTGLTGNRASAGQPSPPPTLAAPFSQGTSETTELTLSWGSQEKL